MIARLHLPSISVNRAENVKSAEIRTPLTYQQRVKSDRAATLVVIFLMIFSGLLYTFLN